MNSGRRVTRRDLSRRRVLLLTISGLTVLATFPVVGHHLLGGGGNLFNGRDTIGNLCVVALHTILAPVHYGYHLALLIGIIYATADRTRAWARLKGALGKLHFEVVPPTGPFADALAHAGAATSDAIIVRGLPNPAFTAGWWKPKIYLNAELAERLNGRELKSLVAHEAAHLRRRDPLRLAVLRFFACLVFWLPALRRLAEDVADEAEFEADDLAASGQPLVLASAILKVALWGRSGRTLQAVVAFTGPDLIEQRVRRLSGERIPRRSHITTRSILAAAVMLGVAVSSGVVMARPISAGSSTKTSSRQATNTPHPGHKGSCSEHTGLALFHLFCDGRSFKSGTFACQHHLRAKTL